MLVQSLLVLVFLLASITGPLAACCNHGLPPAAGEHPIIGGPDHISGGPSIMDGQTSPHAQPCPTSICRLGICRLGICRLGCPTPPGLDGGMIRTVAAVLLPARSDPLPDGIALSPPPGPPRPLA
jgi:hypothetical protein